MKKKKCYYRVHPDLPSLSAQLGGQKKTMAHWPNSAHGLFCMNWDKNGFACLKSLKTNTKKRKKNIELIHMWPILPKIFTI